MLKNTLGFIAVAVVAVISHYFIFQMRYGWYSTGDNFSFLVTGYVIGLLVMVALWMCYPSRIAVVVVAIGMLGFPALLRPDVFAKPDIGFVTYAVIPLTLLVFATYLRSRGND